MNKLLNKFKGCILGGAVGDGLGYPIEFMSEDEIFFTYGENGITEYNLNNGVAEISDDTQMTLFTIDGLLLSNGDEIESIRKCYIDWANTQMGEINIGIEGYSNLMNIKELFASREPGRTCLMSIWNGANGTLWANTQMGEINIGIEGYSNLMNIKELFASREPGRTCLMSIWNGANGTLETQINNSKGCGGIMRTAPIGLYFKNKSLKETAFLAAKASALTHSHELAYLSSAIFAVIIACIVHYNMNIEGAIIKSIEVVKECFIDKEYTYELIEIVEKALKLSKENLEDFEAIHILGEGWVAEETLAIAVYCSLKYSNNFEKGILASVNHNGDSDSTGSITGNILGAYLGIDGINRKFLDKLELVDFIENISEKLYNKKQYMKNN